MAPSGSYISVTSDLVASLLQEILILGIIVVVYFLWRVPTWKSPRRHSQSLTSCVEAHGQYDPWDERGSQARAAEVQAAEHRLLRHLEQREFTPALNLYRAFERDGRDRGFTEVLYSHFIQSAIRVGKIDVVERMLRAMKRNSICPSRKFWQTSLKLLSSRKHFQTCLAAHSLFGTQIPVDKIIFSCLINAALGAGAGEKAQQLLECFHEANLEIKDYVLFFRTYAAMGKVEPAEALLRELGEQASPLMLNLVLLICVNQQQPERGLALLHESHGLQIRTGKSHVDVVSYNTVIKGFSQAGDIKQCLDCLQLMVQRGAEPDDITFSTLLDACMVDKDMELTRSTFQLLLSRDGVAVCTFIKGLVRGGLLSSAMELHEEAMARKMPGYDMATFSVLIKALVDRHELDRALRVVQDMGDLGFRPDDLIATHLLDGCRHTGNHALGKRIFEAMMKTGVQPSEFTLVTMLKLYGRCGAHKEAYDLVANWQRLYGLKPSVIHYTCLMSGCLRTKNWQQAWAAFELMKANGVAPDHMTMATLLPGLLAAQQWERIIMAIETAVEATPPVPLPVQTVSTILSHLRHVPSFESRAAELQALLKGAGVPLVPVPSST